MLIINDDYSVWLITSLKLIIFLLNILDDNLFSSQQIAGKIIKCKLNDTHYIKDIFIKDN